MPPVIKYTGSCLCGASTFVVKGPPRFSVICHCSTCQKWYGGPTPAIVGFPPDALLQEVPKDKLIAYRTSLDLVRYRCSTCGCPVYELADTDGMVHVGYTSLAAEKEVDMADLAPRTHMFYGSARTCLADFSRDGKSKWASYPGVGEPMAS